MSDSTKTTQCDRLLSYMRNNGKVTQIEALSELGIMRLSSRICDLKKQGWFIKSKLIAVKNRYEETCYVKAYWLETYKENEK